MFNSPFEDVKDIPDDASIIFVADIFAKDYAGGAELTTQALIDSCPFPAYMVKSSDLTMEMLEKGFEKYWIFGNFAGLNQELIPSIIANLDYSILEYDYKYCKWRSPEKHKAVESVPCDCENTEHGKLISAFYYGAKSLWWMSEAQQEKYLSLFPFLSEKDNVVLSSVFDDKFFLTIKILRERYENTDKKGWLVLGSASWIKGYDDAVKWCNDNNHEFEVLLNLPYADVLEKMAQAEGFVFLPPGGDTCPRMVIEAKLLGCKLHLNDNVQHKDEIWFDTDDLSETESYLYAARERFWGSIKSSMNWLPLITGYTTLHNCLERKYPWKECIKSMLGFCTEVVVVDGGSNDGTWEQLLNLASTEGDGRIKPYQVSKDWSDNRFAVFDGTQKAEARSRCTGDFCWQQDADELVHEDDYEKIINLARNFPNAVDLVSLPVIEYWGDKGKVRMDVTPWKWRISRNNPKITHGIPIHLRRYDHNGDLFAAPGTDGCDYIFKDSGELVPHANYYNSEAHNLRMHALNGNNEALHMYEEWFSRNIELLPSVHHYSWFNLSRKIKVYKDYWSSHWQSLYDIKQEDVAENNMFFDKPWSSVSDDDIEKLAIKLENKLGGWVFHEKVDFSKTIPHLSLNVSHPKIKLEENTHE